jgi:hypothetical protein
MTTEDKLPLLREIEAARLALLELYEQNPQLLERCNDPRIAQLLKPLPESMEAKVTQDS